MIHPIDRSTKRKRKSNLGFIPVVLVVLLIIIGIFGYFLAYRPYTRIKAKGQVLVASAKQMKEIVAKNDIDLLKNKMNEISTQYKDFENESKSVYWASFIPYVADFKNGVEAGDYMVKAGQETIDAMYPYADLIGFKKGEASFIDRSAEDRLQTAVATLDKMLTKIDSISANIDQAEKRISTIDPNRYPTKLGKTEVRAKIASAKEQFDGMASLFVEAKPLLKKLPIILGKDKEQTYLILFQNDKEQRATGGFLTAYAVFKINQGKISIVKSENIYDLDDTITHPRAPEKILQYHIDVPEFYIRDSNLSPDYVESLKLFNSLYQKSPKKVDYDGIIAIDTHILVDMLRIFGDTEAGGIVFSAKQDARCDCPAAIYDLSYAVGRRVGYVRENRKGVIGDLMYALFYKAIGFSPSKYWGTLAQTMFKNLDEKHILLNFNDPETQQAVEKLNYAGRIKDYDKDYLAINNVNFAGAKSNLYVRKAFTSETKLNDNGKISREVTMDFNNPFPASNCSLKVENGLCMNATLRDWLRVYVPKGSKLVEFKGSLKKVQTYDELGKTVFEGYVEVDPLGRAKAVVSYTLPDSIKANDYSLMIQKQPGEDNLTLKVDVDGAKKFDGDFLKDVVIKP